MNDIQPKPRAAFSYRNDPAAPHFDEGHWHVVMDDRCGLCARAARRIAHLDKGDQIRIAPVRSNLGQSLMRHYGLNPDDPQSWLLIQDGKAFGGLEAMLELFPSLSVRYKPIRILWLLPAPWRARLYTLVARSRYRWFGEADLCAMPDADVQARLLPAQDRPAVATDPNRMSHSG